MMVSMVKFRKITLLLLVLALGWVNKTTAQNYYVEDKSTFFGGVSFGSTFSQLDGDNFAGYRKLGLTGGAIVYAEIAPKFAPSLEFLYTQKGGQSKKNADQNAVNVRVNNYKVNLNYVEIPVLFNYFDKRKSHFGVGASYSQLISQNEQATTTPQIPDSIYSEEKYPFNKYDINGIASVNLHLTKGFFLNIRFQYSLLSVRDNFHPDLGRKGAARQSNNFWAFRLMYIF